MNFMRCVHSSSTSPQVRTHTWKLPPSGSITKPAGLASKPTTILDFRLDVDAHEHELPTRRLRIEPSIGCDGSGVVLDLSELLASEFHAWPLDLNHEVVTRILVQLQCASEHEVDASIAAVDVCHRLLVDEILAPQELEVTMQQRGQRLV